MNFHDFQIAIERQFEKMKKFPLYEVELTKDEMWQQYLSSFPEGSNPIYVERTHHDCQCCKTFIRNMGNVVAHVDGEQVSIWNCTVNDSNYQAVADAMAALVAAAPLARPFLHYEKTIGTGLTRQLLDAGEIKQWEHFHVQLPDRFVVKKDQIGTKVGKMVTELGVFERGLNTITDDACVTVLELIDQNSLYRGAEFRKLVQDFYDLLRKYRGLSTKEQTQFVWDTAFSGKVSDTVRLIRNTVIGTLLVDLSEGKSLDAAVGAFESMVAPSNYKRPTALITQSMIKNAQKAVEELGYAEALERRHATEADITINNVLYADRDVKSKLGGTVFDELLDTKPFNMKSLEKVEEIAIDDFLSTIVPQAKTIELLVENQHKGNLMSLIAPVHPNANNMLMWDNNFSWTYNGEIADSMKDRVKEAGGDVTGDLRFSIQWNDRGKWNQCDYDAHCINPIRERIYYGHMRGRCTGVLDVDIRWPSSPDKPAVENITWKRKRDMQTGTYEFLVHNFAKREGNDGFAAEIEFDGQIHSFDYNQPIPQSGYIRVADVTMDGKGNFSIKNYLPSAVSSQEVWGVPTMRYSKVTMIMHSPNHWDGNQTGNKHYFFILEGCKQPGTVRGFYNEFLNPALREHRKVFEVLGSKMRVEESDEQLSGLGFSTTQRNHVYCKVTGSFTRTLKINF